VSTIHLNELGLVCALGSGRDAVARALFASDAPGGVASNTSVTPGRSLMLGAVRETLPALDALPRELRGRNNALLAAALEQIRPALDAAIAQHGPERVAVVLGTSTSGVGESEAAHRSQQAHGRWPDAFQYAQQEMGTPAAFVALMTGCRGPAYTISTACSSSAKALASAARLLRSGVADAVICGGADSLCAFTIAGFTALGAVSAARCNPFSCRRDGINIGEGAALFLATRAPGPVRLMGWGESADAHHMSAPDPGGAGPETAIRAALQRAALGAGEIDYVNLHGTATLQNDAMEAAVMRRVFGEVAASSTKPLTGHALGAAGAIEAAICWLALAQNPSHTLPPHWWDGEADPALAPLDLVAPGRRAATPLRHVLSQSFAFGGSNAALVLGAA
jgi:3-oxoacyl-[acyl-carrier-protein] synthase I